MKKKLPRHSQLREEGSRLCYQSRVNDSAADQALKWVMETEQECARLISEINSAKERGEIALPSLYAELERAQTHLHGFREARRTHRTLQIELRHRADLLNKLARKAWSAERQRMRSRVAMPTHTANHARSSHRVAVRTVASSTKATADPDGPASMRAASTGGAR